MQACPPCFSAHEEWSNYGRMSFMKRAQSGWMSPSQPEQNEDKASRNDPEKRKGEKTLLEPLR
jgi:hypothetical protein